MPCLDNLLSSTASVLPDFSPCPEFKPFLKDTHFDPELNPDVAQEPGSDSCKLGLQLTESNGDDNKQEEFRGDDGSPVPEPAPGKDFCYLSKPKLRLTEVNDDGGDGIEGALSPCRVKGPTTEKPVQEWSKRRIEEGIPEFKCSLPFLVGAAKSVSFLPPFLLAQDFIFLIYLLLLFSSVGGGGGWVALVVLLLSWAGGAFGRIKLFVWNHMQWLHCC